MTSPGVAGKASRAATFLVAVVLAGIVAPGRAATGPVAVYPAASDEGAAGGGAAIGRAVEARRELLQLRAARIAARRDLIQRVRDALAGRTAASLAECPDGLDEDEVREAVRRLLREEIGDLDRSTAPRDGEASVAAAPREAGTDPAIELRLRELERALDRRERDLAEAERRLELERGRDRTPVSEPLSPPERSSAAPIVPVPVPVPVEPTPAATDRDTLRVSEEAPTPDAPGTPDIAPDEARPDIRVIRESFLSSGLFSSQLILFETAKDRLLPISGPILDAVAEVLREFPDARVRIEGHTDIRGGAEYNRRLSERRAASVRDYLIDSGRIEAARLTVVGLGFDRPLMDGTTPTAHALNRRVTLRILNPAALAAPAPIRN